MRTINKIAERQEIILQRWYEVILEEAGIPIEYCPHSKNFRCGAFGVFYEKDLSEFLYSKLNCSFKTAYEILDMSYEEEKTRRKKEKMMELMIYLPLMQHLLIHLVI